MEGPKKKLILKGCEAHCPNTWRYCGTLPDKCDKLTSPVIYHHESILRELVEAAQAYRTAGWQIEEMCAKRLDKALADAREGKGE